MNHKTFGNMIRPNPVLSLVMMENLMVLDTQFITQMTSMVDTIIPVLGKMDVDMGKV